MTKVNDVLYKKMMFCFGCTTALMVVMHSRRTVEVSYHNEKTFERSLWSKISETKMPTRNPKFKEDLWMRMCTILLVFKIVIDFYTFSLLGGNSHIWWIIIYNWSSITWKFSRAPIILLWKFKEECVFSHRVSSGTSLPPFVHHRWRHDEGAPIN